MISPRDDVVLMEGYHSAQVDVDVRLNTNESPEPPPSAWIDEIADAARDVDWHRYPDRAATELRSAIGALHDVGPEQVFVANGSNEVLQTAAAHLRRAGAHRRDVGAHLRPARPHLAPHRHVRRRQGNGPPTSPPTSRRSVGWSTGSSPSVAFLCSPNNPTGVVDSEATVRATLDLVAVGDGLLVVDEAYGQFAPWSALGLVADDVPLVVTRTFSKTWSMAAARLGLPDRSRPRSSTSCTRSCCPITSTPSSRRPGITAVGHRAEMDARVSRLVEERGRLVTRLGELPVDVWPSGANFVLFRPRTVPGGETWRRLVERSVLVRDCSSWPRLEGCLRVTIGTTEEDDLFLSALEEILT